jgi:hypothetical protein
MSSRTGLLLPTTLRTWLFDLVQSIPARSVATLLELLLGMMLSERGMISQAILAITPRCGWQAYYWFVEHARFPWIRLVHGLCAIVNREFPEPRRFLIIDDTIILRCSPKAPDAAVRFDHVKRTNRPRHMLCQVLVTLSASIIDCAGAFRAVPLLSLPVKAEGNPGKLSIAQALLGTLAPRFAATTLLVDAWYMRRRLVLWATAHGIAVIGQIRRDSALFHIPAPPARRGRGRPRKYGMRITKDVLDALPVSETVIAAYGRSMMRWCAVSCRPRFLSGLEVRVVRVAMKTTTGWTKDRLLLSTDTALSDENIIIGYSRRWPTEPLFRNIKQGEGFREMWMQTRKTLIRWLHIVQTAAALTIMLAARRDPELEALARIGGWRKETRPATPGLVKNALAAAFRYLPPLPLLGIATRSLPKNRCPATTGPPTVARAA